jgi:hypothetical protein
MTNEQKNKIDEQIKKMIVQMTICISMNRQEHLSLLDTMAKLETTNNWSHTLKWVFVDNDPNKTIFHEVSITKLAHLSNVSTKFEIRSLYVNSDIDEKNYYDLCVLLEMIFGDHTLIKMKKFPVSSEFIEEFNKANESEVGLYDRDKYDGSINYEYSEVYGIVSNPKDTLDIDSNINHFSNYCSKLCIVPTGFCHTITENLKSFYSSSYLSGDDGIAYVETTSKEFRELDESKFDKYDETFDFLVNNRDNIPDSLHEELFTSMIGDISDVSTALALKNVTRAYNYICNIFKIIL